MMDEIIIETMLSYNEYLNKLIDGADLISSDIKGDSRRSGLQNILAFSEGIEWLSRVNDKLSTLGYVNEMNINSIQEYLDEINQGLILEDYILVADIFQYEIKPFLQNIKQYEVPNN